MTGATRPSRKRMLTVAAREYRVHVTGALFAALVLLVVAATSTLNPVAMIPGGADINAPVRAVANSVYALSPSLAMAGFFVYPLFASLLAGLSVLRDDEAGMSELLHCTPLTTGEYLWAKFGGVVAALSTAMVLHVVILMLFREFAIGGVARGPFTPTAYLVGAVLFLVPGVLWSAGLSFAIGARTRSAMAVYLLPVLLYMAEFRYFWNWRPAGINPGLDTALMILDPTGLRWLMHTLFAADRGMTWYNTAPLAIDTVLVAGRVVTLMIPLLCVFLVIATAQRTRAVRWPSLARLRTRRNRGAAPVAPQPASAPFRGLHGLAMQQRAPGALRACATVMVSELRALAGKPSLYLFAILLFGIVTEFGGAEADVYGSTAILTAGGIAVNAMPAVTVLMCLFLLFVVVETLHRDRVTGFEAVLFASPVPTSSLVAGKALAVFVLVAVLSAVCIAGGAYLVMAQSGVAVRFWPLLLVFGAVLGPTYVVWIAFITAVMNVVRSRTTTLAVGLAALLLTGAQFMRGSLNWVSNWPLWGALRWTEFGVFPLDGEALLWNRAGALSLSVALFVAARYFFVRTERDPAAARARRTPQRLRRLALRAAALAIVPVVTGSFLSIRIHAGFEGSASLRAAEMYEEANQREWSRVVPAVIQHIDASVSLEPSTRRLDVDASYVMVNRTLAPMSRLPFTIPYTFGPVEWMVNGRTRKPVVTAGLHTLTLDTPLEPGDSVQVGFRYSAAIPQGFSRNGARVPAFITPTSVLLSTHRGDFLPVPGYTAQPTTSVTPVSNTLGEDSVSSLPAGGFNRGWAFTAVMRVRAPRALTVNGVGTKQSQVTDAAHTTTTWVTNKPVSVLNLIGGEFDVRRTTGAAVYFRADHDRSVDVMLTTLSAARARYSTWFFPYPWAELRLSEHADLVTQATSYPTNIAFSEGIGFLTSTGPNGGLAFAVTAHEAAHQWWGHLLAAGTGPGTGLLVEGMADYSTLLLYEAEYGPKARQAYATVLEQQYLERRQRETERPVLETAETTAADEAVLQKKGAWVMWMLHESLGADRMFAGLHEFIAEHQTPGQFATPEAMLATLRRQTTDTTQFDLVVQHWFRTTALPAFVLHNVQCSRMDAKWDCRASLRNTGSGPATVDVAAMHGDSTVKAGIVRTSVAAGATVALTWTVSSRPSTIVVDPDVRVLQDQRQNARADVPPEIPVR